MVLAEFRAPYRGRSTPVNAWWGSFDLAVSLFSGQPADPPSSDFIMRNAMDAQEVAVGWWPGDPRHPAAAFYAYAHPAPHGLSGDRSQPPPLTGMPALGEYILNWDDVRGKRGPARGRAGSSPGPPSRALVMCASGTGAGCRARRQPPPVD